MFKCKDDVEGQDYGELNLGLFGDGNVMVRDRLVRGKWAKLTIGLNKMLGSRYDVSVIYNMATSNYVWLSVVHTSTFFSQFDFNNASVSFLSCSS